MTVSPQSPEKNGNRHRGGRGWGSKTRPFGREKTTTTQRQPLIITTTTTTTTTQRERERERRNISRSSPGLEILWFCACCRVRLSEKETAAWAAWRPVVVRVRVRGDGCVGVSVGSVRVVCVPLAMKLYSLRSERSRRLPFPAPQPPWKSAEGWGSGGGRGRSRQGWCPPRFLPTWWREGEGAATWGAGARSPGTGGSPSPMPLPVALTNPEEVTAGWLAGWRLARAFFCALVCLVLLLVS